MPPSALAALNPESCTALRPATALVVKVRDEAHLSGIIDLVQRLGIRLKSLEDISTAVDAEADWSRG